MEALALDEALGTAETVTLKKGLEAEASSLRAEERVRPCESHY